MMARVTTKPSGRAARVGVGTTRVFPVTPVRIRAAQSKDGETLSGLRRQAEQVHARLLPDYFRVAPARDAMVSATGPSSVILVAEGRDGLNVLGYVTVKVVETPRDPAMTPRRRAHVDTIVVGEAHRGLGIGTALMRAAATWAQKHDAAELVLTVWSENRAAQALYRRLGYRPIARVLRCTLA
jgi:ribosomal protein S18 acetylase RimI-like enzyme